MFFLIRGNVYVYKKKTVTRSATLLISSMIKSFPGLADDNLNEQIYWMKC